MFSGMDKCYGCSYQFSSASRKFYCCDHSHKYCILCRTKSKCDQCYQSILKQVQIPKCSECYSQTNNVNHCWYHKQCDKFICAKCLVARRRSFKGNKLSLQCGHRENIDIIQEFLKDFCMSCGAECNSILDYDLLNGKKCCYFCYKYNLKQIDQHLIRCLSCENICRKFSDTGKCQNGLILCKNCVVLSNIEQDNIKKSFHPEESDKISKQINPNTSESFGRQDYSIGPQSILQKHAPEPMKKSLQDKNQKSKNSKQEKKQFKTEVTNLREERNNDSKPIKKQKSPNKMEIKQIDSQILPPDQVQIVSGLGKLEKLLKKDDVSEKQIRSQKKTILHRFPSDNNNVILKQTKMKKHMSMETFVQAMKLEIKDSNQKIVECAQCMYLIQDNEAYEINQKNNKQNQPLQNKKIYCKLCFTLLTKNSFLSFTRYNPVLGDSRNARGQSSQKYYIKKNTDSGNQHLKVEDPSPKTPEKKMIGKMSSTFEDHNKFHTSRKPNENPRYQPRSIKEQQCTKCKKVGGSMVKTIKQGNICFVCYYKAKQVQ